MCSISIEFLEGDFCLILLLDNICWQYKKPSHCSNQHKPTEVGQSAFPRGQTGNLCHSNIKWVFMAGGRAYEQLLPETKRHNGFRELQMLCPNAKPSGQADWFSEPVTEIRCTHDIQCKIRQYGSSCIRTHIPHQILYFTFSFYNYPLTLGTCSNLLTFCAELLCWKTTEKSYSLHCLSHCLFQIFAHKI